MNEADIHGGNISAVADKLGLTATPTIKYDFSVNLNPLGAPHDIKTLLASGAVDWQNYPDITCSNTIKHLSKIHNIPYQSVTIGNGATELFSIILNAFNIKTADFFSPCYSGYKEVCLKNRVSCKSIFTFSEIGAKAIFIGYPNNPTGCLINRNKIQTLTKDNPDKLFIIDESFMDFVLSSEDFTFIKENIPNNIIIVKSFTKAFNIAGIRLGMAAASADNIKKINKFKLPWSVNAYALAVAEILYNDKQYLEKTKIKTAALREELSKNLSSISDITVYPSETNFLLFKTHDTELQKKLLTYGIFIRSCKNIEGLNSEYFRIAVKKQHENMLLSQTIKKVVN